VLRTENDAKMGRFNEETLQIPEVGGIVQREQVGKRYIGRF